MGEVLGDLGRGFKKLWERICGDLWNILLYNYRIGKTSQSQPVPFNLFSMVTLVDWQEEYWMEHEPTGLIYVISPALVDPLHGVLLYDPQAHSHLWEYVELDGIRYTNQTHLFDWDSWIEEWDEATMGMWPKGNPFPEWYVIYQETMTVTDDLLVHLDNVEWLMNHEELALAFADDDEFNDDDEEEEVQSEDDGYENEEQEEEVIHHYWVPQIPHVQHDE